VGRRGAQAGVHLRHRLRCRLPTASASMGSATRAHAGGQGAVGEDIGADGPVLRGADAGRLGVPKRLDELLGLRKVRRAAVALPPDVAVWVGRLTEAVSREEGR
jgi:hypothetical protein